MTHVPFLIAAYAVFVLVLAADLLGSRLRLRAARKQALQRQQRQQARDTRSAAAPLSTELSR
ncbi:MULTISPECIES: heme exporter protein CcmD [Stenotrophomonas]|uniref:heme exporter protein CcmD n=1 Tax=Stenotrophomonas TaxID=40323 RepID=UPI000871C8F9|nr:MULTISPECIES: heme exporter protein CcmD [Stenotrophomonas]OEZ00239.1 heme exporter protein CcmD [Stenotrophomonas sp. BIIR7]